MVVRDSIHVLPREVMGKSTFELAVALMRWLPLWVVDKLAWFVLGNVDRYGLKRPSMGPLELKNTKGKTPVLDIGALDKIRHSEIKVIPGIRRFFHGGAELVNGEKVEVDSVILATGYHSNVPSWLKEKEFFSEDGFLRSPLPNGWKGKNGLYAVGFTRRGLSGASQDAVQVAGDIRYSSEVKALFERIGVERTVVELDELEPQGPQIQKVLERLTGQHTAPNVFIGGKYFGGCTDTVKLYRQGELEPLLAEANAKKA